MAYGLQEWEQWRQRRENGLRNPLGWLSLIGLHWLGSAPTAFETIPGRWSIDRDIVVVDASAEDGLVYDGAPIDGQLRIKPSSQRISYGDLDIELIRRADWYALRLRDPHAAALAVFDGVPSYPFSEAWVVEGQLEPFEQPQAFTLGTVIDGLTNAESAVGVVRFHVNGEEYALTAFDGGDGDLDFLFRDATSGVTTYAASRSLGVDKADADGRVVLDFNRAYNMPCAFTEFATCPLPPGENILPLAVTAGEQKPG
jgi:uncharacterized protein